VIGDDGDVGADHDRGHEAQRAAPS
jgi:hypothetical protein